MNAAEISIAEKAKIFAIDAHSGQNYGAHPYMLHLEGVVAILKHFGYIDDHILAAAWLHDVLEDTNTTKGDLAHHFPDEVICLVDALTDRPGANRRERNALTYPRIRKAGRDAVAIKLADRISNTIVSLQDGTRFMKMYQSEYPRFRELLWVPGEHAAMWRLLEVLNEPGRLFQAEP
jgi:(p)ppGpp synthase/HD superfamily hydrolase